MTDKGAAQAAVWDQVEAAANLLERGATFLDGAACDWGDASPDGELKRRLIVRCAANWRYGAAAMRCDIAAARARTSGGGA